ncbi:MAG TPA: trypsin-like peptidase domain-containing protein [Chloroflexota bacterium]|nr:trypsin-like peptidase domain-containing protein [Chloroflexota bacterium]
MRVLVSLLLLLSTTVACAAGQATAQQSTVTPPTATTSAPAAAATSAPPTAVPTATAVPQAQATVVAGTQPATSSADAPMTQGLISQIGHKATPGIVQITNEQFVLQPSGREAVPAGAGTGFVIDNQGHILTNNHVVAQAQRLEVQATDGKTFNAKLVGRDPRTDLAVVQVDGANLPPLPLGDSSKLVVGQWVVAIGNALALEGGPTLTVGVVSALNRTVQEPPDQQGNPGPFLFDLIQTDAAINPGNSGGPLLDLNGNVVGINTLGAGMAEPGVQAQGISFAIAINTAKRIADQLIQNGKVDYAFMGVSVTPNTPALAARFGLANVPGMAVTDVGQGTPAARAGIQPKDVITAVDGQPLKSESDLSRILSQHKPGDTVTVSVARGNSPPRNVQVTLGTAPANA